MPVTAVLYTSVALTGDDAVSILDKAVNALLATQGSDIKVLWSLKYQQGAKSASTNADDNANIIRFPDTPLDLAFEDTILDNVKQVWKTITGGHEDEFMKFEDREAAAEEDSEEEDE